MWRYMHKAYWFQIQKVGKWASFILLAWCQAHLRASYVIINFHENPSVKWRLLTLYPLIVNYPWTRHACRVYQHLLSLNPRFTQWWKFICDLWVLVPCADLVANGARRVTPPRILRKLKVTIALIHFGYLTPKRFHPASVSCLATGLALGWEHKLRGRLWWHVVRNRDWYDGLGDLCCWLYLKSVAYKGWVSTFVNIL